MERRRVLAAVGTLAGVAAAGCNGLESGDGQAGEGDTREVIVTNSTEESVLVGVRLEDSEGAELYSRVYDLGAGKADETGGVEARPATVTAFTRSGESEQWEYAPVAADLPCETGQDVVISVRPDGTLRMTYAC